MITAGAWPASPIGGRDDGASPRQTSAPALPVSTVEAFIRRTDPMLEIDTGAKLDCGKPIQSLSYAVSGAMTDAKTVAPDSVYFP